METLDSFDRKILTLLQADAALSLDDLGAQVGLSRNACWRRVRLLEERGVLKGRVALVDPDKVGLGLQVFVQLRAPRHSADWLRAFRQAVSAMPEILGVYRMSGDLDYLIRARVDTIAGYDALYQRLISKVELRDVSASFVMEELKDSTALPL